MGFPIGMDEKRYDVDAVKERLNEYREKERDIDNQIERLERLTSKLTGVGAQIITDMPRAPSVAGDRMAELIGQKEELELSIREAVAEQSEEWKAIESILVQLKHSDERAVIRMRYHDREAWNVVTKMMFGSRADFDGKAETYLRRIHKIHGSALLNMARINDCAGQNTAILMEA